MLRRPDRFLVYAGNAWYEQPQPVSEVVLIDRLHLETKTRLCRRPSRMSAPTFEKKSAKVVFHRSASEPIFTRQITCDMRKGMGRGLLYCPLPTNPLPSSHTTLPSSPHLTSHLRALFTIRSIVSSPFALLLSFRDFYWLK